MLPGIARATGNAQEETVDRRNDVHDVTPKAVFLAGWVDEPFLVQPAVIGVLTDLRRLVVEGRLEGVVHQLGARDTSDFLAAAGRWDPLPELVEASVVVVLLDHHAVILREARHV